MTHTFLVNDNNTIKLYTVVTNLASHENDSNKIRQDVILAKNNFNNKFFSNYIAPNFNELTKLLQEHMNISISYLGYDIDTINLCAPGDLV